MGLKEDRAPFSSPLRLNINDVTSKTRADTNSLDSRKLALAVTMASFYSGDYVGAVVADIGQYATKIGWAGDDYPRSYFRSVSVMSLVCLACRAFGGGARHPA